MSSKATKLFGQVRICTKNNLTWHGFTLQRGHFYGCDEHGYFVSGLLSRANGLVKVYRASQHNEIWRSEYIRPDNTLAQKLLAAAPVRAQMGINQVEFIPLRQQFVPDLPHMRQSGRIFPWTPMHIPCPGTGTKTSGFVSAT